MSDLNVTSSVVVRTTLEGATGVEEQAPIKEEDRIVDVKSEIQNEDVNHGDVQDAVTEINHFMQSMQRNLSFSVDEQLGCDIISVTDMETDAVIRQIPSEELLVLRQKMDDVAGILFDTKV